VLSDVLALVVLNWAMITRRYMYEPIGFLLYARKKGRFLNLTGLALPSQIVPDFQLSFARDPTGRCLPPGLRRIARRRRAHGG